MRIMEGGVDLLEALFPRVLFLGPQINAGAQCRAERHGMCAEDVDIVASQLFELFRPGVVEQSSGTR